LCLSLPSIVDIYHLAFRDDDRYIKVRFPASHAVPIFSIRSSIVYGLYILECVQVVMTTHDAFAMLGAGWGNLEALHNPHWLWFDTPVLSGISESAARCHVTSS
jgi:hypothetical protein